MSPTNKKDKLIAIKEALVEIHNEITAGKVISFVDVIKKYSLQWSAGSQSLRAILVDKMKMIEGRRGKQMNFTDTYVSKYKEMDAEKVAEIVLRYMDRWVSTPRHKEEEVVITGGPVNIDVVNTGIQVGHTVTIELTPFELAALKTILSFKIVGSAALQLVAEEIAAKLF